MVEEYIRAKKRGDKAIRKAMQEGRYPYLAALDDFVPDLDQLAQYPVGMQELPLASIVGSRTRGRTNAFTWDFMPCLESDTEFAAKWWYLLDSQKEEGIREAIKVYEYMWNFYVEEGNKRVSVSKYVGNPEILADVVRIIPRKTDDKDVRIYYEFMDFFEVCPLYELRFSEEGAYRRLAELAHLGLNKPWPEDAVMELKSAFYTFERMFEKLGGGSLDMTTADAFLIYNEFYRFGSITEEPDKELERRIGMLWKELQLEAGQESVALSTSPEVSGIEEGNSDSFISGILKRSPSYTADNPLRVAFVYDKTAENSGWVRAHEMGREHLKEVFGDIVDTVKFENCGDEESVKRALMAAAADDDRLVFTTSIPMLPVALRSAVRCPDLEIFNCSVNLPHSLVRCYYGRMYEAKFLMGALAASLSDNHKIGYCAHIPTPGSISNINAFAIGAALVDPRAQVYLKWPTKKDTDWRRELYLDGIGIFSGPELLGTEEGTREFGVYCFDDKGEILNLAAPIWDWGVYYEKIVRSVLKGSRVVRKGGKEQSVSDWWGLNSGLIDIFLSGKLSYYSKRMVGALRKGVVEGRMDPFEGELRSQTGLIQGADAGSLPMEEILTMDWLNDNVIGEIPAREDMIEPVQSFIRMDGVNK